VILAAAVTAIVATATMLPGFSALLGHPSVAWLLGVAWLSQH
jgi:hypothetical protein